MRFSLASARLRVLIGAVALLAGAAPAALAQPTGTGVSATGGATPGSIRVPEGQIEFDIRVPLRPNAENVLTVTAVDGSGRTATVPNLSVTQLTLTDIVRARVTSQRLTPQEVRALVAEGTINLADPDNYNVSRFVVALTIEGREIQISVPVIRKENFEIGTGEAISIGCSSGGGGVQTTERAISIPCGNGGSDGPPPPPIRIIPFEVVADVPGQPTIPGVILIEGRIKTLKEFYKVTLFLMNVSSIFTLSDVEATLELPEGALTHVAPASGLVRIDTLEPGEEGSGEFIIRGDQIGTHTVTAHFGGRLSSPFLSEPVPIAGSASTDVVVKGPPVMAVKLSHPDYVVAGVPYDLIVDITNTDTELDALYASLALDVGHDAYIIDDETGERVDSPVDRSLGDILRGEHRVNRYRVMPLVTGAIASCTAAASQNLQLTIGFTGGSGGPVCAIGTLPAERTSPDGKPTVTVIPTHNTTGVALNPAIVALFSAPMITQTITTGYPEATFKVIDQAGNIVPGNLFFGVLFDATSAVFRPAVPFTPEQTYTIVVESGIFSEEGLSLASGSISRFVTGTPPPPPDNQPPSVTLAVEAPLSATSIPRGQMVGVAATVTDNVGFTRIELYLDGQLIDTKRPGTNLRFLVDTAALAAGSTHEIRAIALDPIGNQGHQILSLQIAGDSTPPVASLLVASSVGRGGALDVTVNATDDGRVSRVDLFLDSAAEPLWSGLVEPFRTTLDTSSFTPGARRLRAVVVDGAGNQTIAESTVTVTADLTPPIVAFVRPLGGVDIRRGALLQTIVAATDEHGVASVSIYLDGEATPRAIGASGFALDTTTLSLGAHQLRARAVDTAGNGADAVAAFMLVTTPSDDIAPNAPLAARITPTPGANGLLTLTGAPGAAEGLTLLSVVNLETRATAQTFVAADGSFTVNTEGAAGETLSLVAIDSAENRSPETRIRVPEPLRLTSLVVTPSPIALDRTTRSVQLSVAGLYSDGTSATLTTNLSYASSTPAVAAVTTDGLVLAGINGTTTITVGVFEPAGVPVVTIPVTTNFPTVTGATVAPTAITLAGVGTSQRITVTATLSDGSSEPFSGRVQFGSQNVRVAVVDSTGLVRGLTNGQTTISVVATGFPAMSVPVTITNREATALLVSPNTLLLSAAGQSASLVASLRYNDGSTSAAPGVVFTALDPAVATVEANGLVTAAAEGLTTIVVAAGGFTVNVPVTVDFPSQLPPPVLTSFGRQIAGEGDTLVIHGDNFSALPFDNDVTITGVAAPVLRAAHDRLVVRVPRGATTGPVQVVVDEQTSNQITIQIYARRAAATALTGAFSVPTPTQGQSIVMGPVTIDVRAGDEVKLSGHAETVVGRTFSTIPGPAFTGTLLLTIDGVPTMIAPSPTPIDLTAQLSPGDHTISAELTATGGSLSSQGLAILSGPTATGVFTGTWSLTGDAFAATKAVRFTQLTTLAGQPIADGAVVGVRGDTWYRVSDGGYSNGAEDAGRILNGTTSPTNSDLKLFTVQNGAITAEYSDQGIFVPFDSTRLGVISVLEMNGANYANSRPIAAATIQLNSVHSASIIPAQTSTLADGVDRPFEVEINSVRDNVGNRVPDGVGVGLTGRPWYRRSDGGYSNGSAGGDVSGGQTVPNDGDFRAFVLADGAARGLYSSGSLAFATTDVRTTTIAALVVDANRNRQQTRPFAEGTVTLSGVAFGTATGSALPTSLAATTADNRSVITVRNLVDAEGRPLPDGARVSATAASWYRVSDGGCCNGAAGGGLVSGTPDPTDNRFRMHTVQNGEVVITYSAAGEILGPGQTSTAMISVLPATPNGKIGSRPFLAVPVTLAGLSNATVTPAISSTPADGVARPITVTVSNIVDALGLPVPDGTKVGMTADNWYRVTDGGCCNSSHGGAFTDGEASSDSRFRVYTVANGSFTATFSAASAPVVGSFGSQTTYLSPIIATTTNTLPVSRPFAVGAIALTNGANGTITATPPTLLGDTADRRSTIQIGSLTDAQGRPLPDGTKVAVTAANWYRVSDGGCCNSSFGGAIVDGTTSASNTNFKWFVVQNGSVTATFSNAGLTREAHQTADSVISVMPADLNGNPIGSRPMLSTPVTSVGLGSGLFTGPATLLPGATTTVTLSNISDHTGAIVPNGTKIALTSVNWYRASDGGCCNSSTAGTLSGGAPALNDGNFIVVTVNGGSVTFSFTAPGANNVTSVISAVSAGPTGNRVGQTPFAAVAIRATTTP